MPNEYNMNYCCVEYNKKIINSSIIFICSQNELYNSVNYLYTLDFLFH